MKVPTRSRNNNIFHYSAQSFQNYSRVLFHDAGGPAMEKMRVMHNIPSHIKTVEIDLTAINPNNPNHWKSHVQYGNIRCHSTPLKTSTIRQEFFGSLPVDAEEWMAYWLMPSTIDILLHADILPLIDFDMYASNNNGGTRISQCIKTPPGELQYLHACRIAGGGPGLLLHDITDEYKQVVAYMHAKATAVCPAPGLRTEVVPAYERKANA